jgi:hypothetical protein
MKFGRLLARAEQLGFDTVATGHHARVVETVRGRFIARGADAAKDQSYVLYMLGPHELARTLLPVGELTKPEVRARAAALGLRTADKRESMDVCFITRGGRSSFLGARIPRRPGTIVDADGAFVAAHPGSRERRRPLLHRAVDTASRVDQEKPGRSPRRELPSEHVFVEAACARAIVGMNREVRNVIGHLEIRIRRRVLGELALR